MNEKNIPTEPADFCDMMCKFAEFPDSDALDGSGSCRTFIAVYCAKRREIVRKNSRCTEKEYE